MSKRPTRITGHAWTPPAAKALAWLDSALCPSSGLDFTAMTSKYHLQECAAVCAKCTVRTECLTNALEAATTAVEVRHAGVRAGLWGKTLEAAWHAAQSTVVDL